MSREISFYITNKEILNKDYPEEGMDWIGSDSTLYCSFPMSSIQAQCLNVFPDNKETLITYDHIGKMRQNLTQKRIDIERNKRLYNTILNSRNTSDEDIYEYSNSIIDCYDDMVHLDVIEETIKCLHNLISAFEDIDNKLNLQLIGYIG